MKQEEFRQLYPWARNDGIDPYAEAFFTVDLDVSREEIWPFLCDTSRLNRAAGLGKRVEKEVSGQLHVRERLMGMALAWIEHPWVWLDQSHNLVEREYTEGPFKFFRCVFHIEDRPGGVTVCVQFAWTCKFRVLAWLLPIGTKDVVKRFTRVLKHVEASVREKRPETNPFLVCVPVTNTETTRRLAAIESRLHELPLDHGVVRSLVGFVRCGDELEVQRLRPLKRARPQPRRPRAAPRLPRRHQGRAAQSLLGHHLPALPGRARGDGQPGLDPEERPL